MSNFDFFSCAVSFCTSGKSIDGLKRNELVLLAPSSSTKNQVRQAFSEMGHRPSTIRSSVSKPESKKNRHGEFSTKSQKKFFLGFKGTPYDAKTIMHQVLGDDAGLPD